jgi:hypothetical protein
MNPYTTPTQHADEENAGGDEWTAAPEDHPQYGIVLKMVMWGEDRDEIFHRLSVNGVPDGVAQRLHAHAREDRLRTIRGVYSRRFLVGMALIVAAVAVFVGFWFYLEFIPRIILFCCIVALGIGSWKFIDGLAGYLMAPSQKGSVADDD